VDPIRRESFSSTTPDRYAGEKVVLIGHVALGVDTAGRELTANWC